MKQGIKILILPLVLAFSSYGQSTAETAMASLSFHSDLEKSVLIGGNSKSTLDYLLAVDLTNDKTSASEQKEIYSKNLAFFKKQQQRYNNDEHFLKFLFYKVHRSELKKYEQYVSFSNQIEEGAYDCLTATSLYALYLIDLGFKVDIVEMDYHIYLKVRTGEKSFLFESTDPIGGFLASEKEIAQKEVEYMNVAAESLSGIGSNSKGAQQTHILNGSLNQSELIGLHYYNQAIIAWNEKNTAAALVLIEKAYYFYPSNRISSLQKFFSRNVDLLASK